MHVSYSFMMNTRKKIINYRNNTTNANYFKLDTLIRNPAPPSVPMSEVLKKAGGLFSAGLNLKAYNF